MFSVISIRTLRLVVGQKRSLKTSREVSLKSDEQFISRENSELTSGFRLGQLCGKTTCSAPRNLQFSEHVEYLAAASHHALGLTVRLFNHPQQQLIRRIKETDQLWDPQEPGGTEA